MSPARQAILEELQALQVPPLSGNIYAIGRNYRDHALELNNPIPQEPVLFLKAPSSLRQAALGPIAYPEESFHHELELVFLLDPKQAAAGWESVAAVSLGLDLTRRGVQSQLKQQGLPWTLAKSFQGAAIVGPWKKLAGRWWQEPIDLNLEVNGELRQQGSSADMIFDIPTLLQFLRRGQELEAGDLLFSGTPAGVGPIRQGDSFRMRSERLGIDCRGVL
ncbi:MAG: fumarylacetoacetate hydrolase family protein [Oligoflexus sp.]